MSKWNIAPANRQIVFDKTGGHCAYCGKDLKPEMNWHVEHRMPFAACGDRSMNNLFPSCIRCNRLKRGHTPEGFKGHLMDTFLKPFLAIQDRIHTLADFVPPEEIARLQAALDALTATHIDIYRNSPPRFYTDATEETS